MEIILGPRKGDDASLRTRSFGKVRSRRITENTVWKIINKEVKNENIKNGIRTVNPNTSTVIYNFKGKKENFVFRAKTLRTSSGGDDLINMLDSYCKTKAQIQCKKNKKMASVLATVTLCAGIVGIVHGYNERLDHMEQRYEDLGIIESHDDKKLVQVNEVEINGQTYNFDDEEYEKGRTR